MLKYPISPDDALIIKAINEATTLRGAASVLDMDPSQLVRKVQKMSTEHGLLHKVGNRWVLTELGKRLALWVDESIVRQKLLMAERPMIRIACYTWLAEQMLIPRYKKLKTLSEGKYIWNMNVSAGDLEQELISSRADFVITCHAPNDPLIAQKKISPDPWFIIAPPSWKKDLIHLKGPELQEFLNKKPFVRLSNLGPDQTLGFTPRTYADLMIEGVIGVRSAVKASIGWSCIPGLSVIQDIQSGELLKLDLTSKTRGDLSLWWMRSRKDCSEYVKILSKWISD